MLLDPFFEFIEYFFSSGFQDPATPVMEGIIDLHNYTFTYLILIFLFVFVIFCNILYEFYFLLYIDSLLPDYMLDFENPSFWDLDVSDILSSSKFSSIVHETDLELAWTTVPSIILMLIAVPSFSLLYTLEEFVQPTLTLKVVGHQWYWNYQYATMFEDKFTHFSFDSNPSLDSSGLDKALSYLEVDKFVVLPLETHIRVLVTSYDVLHSWAVPMLGVKMDAIPGRLNQVSLFIKRGGLFYGQCSELCGVNHGFMPIGICVTNFSEWLSWYERSLGVELLLNSEVETKVK